MNCHGGRLPARHHGPPAYQHHLVPAFFAPLADALVALDPPRPGEQVLDLACGTGVVARRAADRVGPGGRVIGVDVNQAMIDFARGSTDTVGSSGSSPTRPDARSK